LVRLECFDIQGGIDRHEVGIFESIQVTGQEVRDEHDNILLHGFIEYGLYDDGVIVWYDTKTGNGWYDWTVETV